MRSEGRLVLLTIVVLLAGSFWPQGAAAQEVAPAAEPAVPVAAAANEVGGVEPVSTAAQPSSVGDEEAVKANVHGFGSWSYGRTSHNGYLSGDPRGSYQNADFSLNVSSIVGRSFTAFAQVEWRRTTQGDEFLLNYAFAEWKFSDALRIRAGQVKQPFGISTEVFNVGTLRPFLELPQAVYGPVSLLGGAFYQGVGMTGYFGLDSGWGISYDLYGGGIDVAEFHAPEEFARDGSVSSAGVFVEAAKDIVGGRINIDLPVAGLRVGASGYSGRELESGTRYVYGAHIEYLTTRLSLRSEYAHHTTVRDFAVDGAYAEAAFRFATNWQVAGQYDWSASHFPPGAEGAVLDNHSSFLKHQEGVLGVNYWFSPNLVFKMSHHLVQGNRLAVPVRGDVTAMNEAFASPMVHTRTYLFAFGAQFSF